MMHEIAAIGTFIASAITTLIALIAGIVAIRQIRTLREIEALNAYENYHKMYIENIDVTHDGFVYKDADPASKSKYQMMTLSMLLTIERIITLFPNDQQWKHAFIDDIERFSQTLEDSWFDRHRPSIDAKVLELIDGRIR